MADSNSFEGASDEDLLLLLKAAMEALRRKQTPEQVTASTHLSEEDKENNGYAKEKLTEVNGKPLFAGSTNFMDKTTDFNASEKGFTAKKRPLPFGRQRPEPTSLAKEATTSRSFYIKNKYGNFEGHKDNKFILGVRPTAKTGAQHRGLCAAHEMVTSITVEKNFLNCILTDGTEVHDITEFEEFYKTFSPAPGLHIRSNDYGTFKDFYDSNENLALWAHEVSQVTLSGTFSAEHLKLITKTLEYVEIFQLHDVVITESKLTFDEWINCLPYVSQITVDARAFSGSSYRRDFHDAVEFLSRSHDGNQSLTVITKHMVDPATLKSMIDDAVQCISGTCTLNFVTEAPLYREINSFLYCEMNYGMGATDVTLECYDRTIQATYFHMYDECTINFGFTKINALEK